MILDYLGKLIYGKPASVLDVGTGFGRWGFLCRCHFEKMDGEKFLDIMKEKACASLIIALPLGAYPQGLLRGNEYEIHRSTWMQADFAGPNTLVRAFGQKGREGVVFFFRNAEAAWHVKMMRSPVRRWAWRRAFAMRRGCGERCNSSNSAGGTKP